MKPSDSHPAAVALSLASFPSTLQTDVADDSPEKSADLGAAPPGNDGAVSGVFDKGSTTREHVLAMVAHDLRNPMTAIDATTTLLQRELDRAGLQGGNYLECFNRIRLCLARMDELVTQLLEVPRIHGKHLPLRKRETDARELALRVLDELRHLASVKGQAVVVDVPNLAVRCDEGRILQVLSNLLENAIKFAPDGGHLRVFGTAGADGFTFGVEDSGPGIAAAEAHRVFEPFWQGESQAGQGVGLGLAIAHSIVVAHGGRIWVEPSTGGGSRFCFTLPQL